MIIYTELKLNRKLIMLKLYVTTQMIIGEAIRYIATQNNITVRQIGINIGMSEGNVSRLLSEGMGYNKNIENVISAINSTLDEVNKVIQKINDYCVMNNLEIKTFVSEENKDIIISNKQLQKLITSEINFN